MQKNKYEMIAGWETMGYLDKKSQEICENISKRKMLTSEAHFKFKKQLCNEELFFKNLSYSTKIETLPNGKVLCNITWENEYIQATFTFIEFKTNFCSL